MTVAATLAVVMIAEAITGAEQLAATIVVVAAQVVPAVVAAAVVDRQTSAKREFAWCRLTIP
jgi:hypothetical protein